MKLFAFIVVVCGTMMPCVGEQVDAPVDTTRSDSILIVKGESFFEDTVVSFVKRRLEHDALYTRVCSPDNAAQVDQANFAAVVLLHAVESYRLSAAYGPFVNRASDGMGTTKVIISTISGEPWKEGVRVDGISGATKPYRPDQVGMRLYSQIRAVIDRK